MSPIFKIVFDICRYICESSF